MLFMPNFSARTFNECVPAAAIMARRDRCSTVFSLCDEVLIMARSVLRLQVVSLNLCWKSFLEA